MVSHAVPRLGIKREFLQHDLLNQIGARCCIKAMTLNDIQKKNFLIKRISPLKYVSLAFIQRSSPLPTGFYL